MVKKVLVVGMFLFLIAASSLASALPPDKMTITLRYNQSVISNSTTVNFYTTTSPRRIVLFGIRLKTLLAILLAWLFSLLLVWVII